MEVCVEWWKVHVLSLDTTRELLGKRPLLFHTLGTATSTVATC